MSDNYDGPELVRQIFLRNRKIEIYKAAFKEIIALYDDEDWPDDSGAMLQPLEIAERALASKTGEP